MDVKSFTCQPCSALRITNCSSMKSSSSLLEVTFTCSDDACAHPRHDCKTAYHQHAHAAIRWSNTGDLLCSDRYIDKLAQKACAREHTW